MSYVTGFLTFMSIGGFPSFVEDMKVISYHAPLIESLLWFRSLGGNHL